MVGTVKVTISGSYKSSSREIIDFERVTGIAPYLSDEKLAQMVIKRYAPIWIKSEMKPDGEPKYKHIQKIRQVFIDNVEDGPSEPLSYIGKNIMEMSFEELQDLASAKDLAAVPLYKSGSLVHARRVAFSEYAIKVLGYDAKTYGFKEAGFNPSSHAPIIVDGATRISDEHVANIEESIDREALVLNKQAKPSESRLTLDQLKAIATSRNIPFHHKSGYESLYAKIYGGAVA